MQQDCCGDKEPQPYFKEIKAPVCINGKEADCPICGTMEKQGIPNAVVVARLQNEEGEGEEIFTCNQLYDVGLNGCIPGSLCGILQGYAKQFCGCGHFNPECMLDLTQCYDYTGPVHVPVPVPVPVEPQNKKSPKDGTYNTLPRDRTYNNLPRGGK
jgi:hypothetical protein